MYIPMGSLNGTILFGGDQNLDANLKSSFEGFPSYNKCPVWVGVL